MVILSSLPELDKQETSNLFKNLGPYYSFDLRKFPVSENAIYRPVFNVLRKQEGPKIGII